MASSPITVRLRCTSWEQLEAIHRRDLSRSALFLRTSNRPPLAAPISVHLTLPSGTLIILTGRVGDYIPPGGLGGRGPGVELALDPIPASTMWLVEAALKSHRREAGAARPDARADNSAAREPAAPSMEAGANVVAAESELVAALEAELASLRGMNAYQILGLAPGAGEQAVRDAFAGLSKRYHPDKYARYDSRTARELAAEIFILIRDAYRTLRSQPTLAPNGAPARESESPGGPVAEPARAAPPRAHARPDSAADDGPESEPTSPRAKHARADALLDAGRFDEALTLYGLASRRDPNDREALIGVELAEGLKALSERNRLEAAQRFEAVLEFDPDNDRAARGLTEIRRQATEERKGFLSRLLGEKE